MFDDEKWPGKDELEEIKFEEIVDLDLPDRDAEQVAGGPGGRSGLPTCRLV